MYVYLLFIYNIKHYSLNLYQFTITLNSSACFVIYIFIHQVITVDILPVVDLLIFFNRANDHYFFLCCGSQKEKKAFLFILCCRFSSLPRKYSADQVVLILAYYFCSLSFHHNNFFHFDFTLLFSFTSLVIVKYNLIKLARMFSLAYHEYL